MSLYDPEDIGNIAHLELKRVLHVDIPSYICMHAIYMISTMTTSLDIFYIFGEKVDKINLSVFV